MRSIVKCDFCGKEFEITKEKVMTDLVRKMVWCPYCDKENILDLYICDPKKNMECPKYGCQKECFATWCRQFAKEPIQIVDSKDAYEKYDKELNNL